MKAPCIHGKVDCARVFCRLITPVIKKESIQLLCGYHMGVVNGPALACILDSINCEECALLENVLPFRRTKSNVC